MISTRLVELVIDTVVCLTLAKWETVSGQFGGYLTSRDRRHSSSRCSCRVVPPIRDVRFVDLNLAVFMCNSGRARQERVCRAQRPAAKIDAIATSAGGRDRTSRI